MVDEEQRGIELEQRGDVWVLHMRNDENRFNRDSIGALHAALDRVEGIEGPAALVTTGDGKFFSNGLDLDWLMAGGEGTEGFVDEVHRLLGRVLGFNAVTVAAVNGHAFAGGLITSAVCDHRIAVDSDARFSLNEVPIGIPMPAVYVRMLGYAWGEKTAARTSLFGETFTPQQALHLGIFDELVAEDDLLDRAVAVADSVPDDCLEHYAFTKRATQAAALRDITELADPLDTELPTWMTSDSAQHAHRRYWKQLKGTPAPW
jgi:enoyl-CoA hydratase